MTIGTALVIIAVLYLIDKHSLWKRAVAVLVVAVIVALLSVAGYYGWEKWEERKAHAKAEAALESQWQVVDEEPNWNIVPPPRGFVSEDAPYVILYPIKADQKTKTDAWKWYRDSVCVSDSPNAPSIQILHNPDLFNFGSYDPRWMSAVALPLEVKTALWSAKVAECHLQPGAKGVKACLDRATGVVDIGPWVEYATSCGPKREVIYLQSDGQKTK